MELLLRRAVGGAALHGAPGRARLLLAASYRTKRNQAKRAAAMGLPPPQETRKPKGKAPAKKVKGQDDAKRAAPEPAEHRPSLQEIEEEWSAMRARTTIVPPPVLPLRTRKEIENTKRMRRLGLLPEDADGEWEGYAETKDRPELHRQQRSKQQQHPLNFQSEKSSSGRFPTRRPVAEKDKQFTNMQSAPEEVVEREYLMPDEPENPKALDIAVIGRPNAGKSSIMNGVLDVTVSAVSAKYNTTRDRVLGIYTKKDTQITFYDTPGLIKPKESHEYVRSLVTTAAETVESVDMSMLVVDAVKRLDDDAFEAMEKVITTSAQVSSPIMLVMNKFDLVGEREEINMNLKIKDISQMIEEIYARHYDADEASLELDPLAYIGDNALKVSALKGYGMKRLKKTLVSLAVDRPWNYHSSMKSDQSDLDMVTEIIREKLFRRFNKELPYSFEQENVGWTKFKDKSIRIDQDIFVPAARVRKMVVGHNGDTIRSVGISAREEIEELLKRPVHLYLNVRVRS